MTTTSHKEIDAPAGGGATIVLSTFNGVRFLDELLRSLSCQNYPDVDLIVRDDGSSDATVDILERWKGRLRIRAIERAHNIGASQSFFRLLNMAPKDRFVLLADQDDIWYPDKVARAVAALRAAGDAQPTLYCARLAVCDSNGNVVNHSPLWPNPPSFGNALVENIATGCTIALNPAFMRLVHGSRVPKRAIMHDWWLYLMATAFGSVVYDPNPCASYRLHEKNVVGLPSNRIHWLASRIKRQRTGNFACRVLPQAMEFQEIFDDRLSERDAAAIAMLRDTVTWSGRWRFIRQDRVQRQFAFDTLALKALVAARRSGTR